MWTLLGPGQSVQYIGVSTFQFCKIYIIIHDDDRAYVCMQHHTLVDTSFKLISDFFHVNQGVLCCEHAEQAGGGGGGGNRFAK